MIRDLIIANRTCRRFDQSVPISIETLRELVDLARLSASGSNRQPLKYYLSCSKKSNEIIYSSVGWAIYGTQRDPGPPEGQRPSAYIIVLLDTEIAKSAACDHGIAAQSIFLGAREKGFGGTIHGTVKKDELSKALGIPPRYQIVVVLSLGKPAQKVVIETVGANGDWHYWLDSEGVHHVPKRSLKELIVGESA